MIRDQRRRGDVFVDHDPRNINMLVPGLETHEEDDFSDFDEDDWDRSDWNIGEAWKMPPVDKSDIESVLASMGSTMDFDLSDVEVPPNGNGDVEWPDEDDLFGEEQ